MKMNVVDIYLHVLESHSVLILQEVISVDVQLGINLPLASIAVKVNVN
jgi:hypothetical protein